ncbi:MAG: RsmG family class I SAM-dependent methyltransferase [Myxococcota bacterium]
MSLLDAHRRELQRFRSSMNLIGPGDAEQHFTDCIEGLAPYQLDGRWVDLGSGAGFPGLVMLELFPHLQLDLVESRQKRATFLRHVLLGAGISSERAQVHQCRVEELPTSHWNGVISRAFAPPTLVLQHAERLLHDDGGELLFFLQHDGALPTGNNQKYQHLHTHRYSVDERERMTVHLRWVGTN